MRIQDMTSVELSLGILGVLIPAPFPDTKTPWVSLFKMVWHLCLTYTHPPVYFKQLYIVNST